MVALLLAGIVCAQGAPTPWVPFRPEGSRIEVELPGKPELCPQFIATMLFATGPPGPHLSGMAHQLLLPKEGFFLGIVDRPDAASWDLKALPDIYARSGGSLLYSRNIEVQGRKGIAFEGIVGQVRISLWAVADGKRRVLLAYGAPRITIFYYGTVDPPTGPAPSEERFFKSLRFLDPAPPAKAAP